MLLIYLPQHTSRSKYIFDRIFTEEFGVLYHTTNARDEFEKYTQEKINYSSARFTNELFIKSHALLAENSISPLTPPVSFLQQQKVLFANDASCDLGFDIFSAAFYMLSRYEEYLPFIPDKYGRFNAKNSVAFKNNFLKTPLVDYWVEMLKQILQKKIPHLVFKLSKFNAIVTYDIDVAYKFKGRSFWRNMESTAKDLLRLDLNNIKERIKTLNNTTKDPWDSYDYLKEIITKNNLSSIFFFLLADKSANDRNLDYKNPAMKSLINKIKTFSSIGIHPSFKTSLFPEKIFKEKQRLEEIYGENITKSRQHFLKFILPDTFNYLIKAGIAEDYSMSYATHPGFRAGTSKAFYFYDLKNEKQTTLRIFPVAFMEGHFMQQKKFTKDTLLQTINDLAHEVKKMNGTFISIWHNHTVSDSAEFLYWRQVHEKMIKQIIAMQD